MLTYILQVKDVEKGIIADAFEKKKRQVGNKCPKPAKPTEPEDEWVEAHRDPIHFSAKIGAKFAKYTNLLLQQWSEKKISLNPIDPN